jgi:hypothetical protein
MLKHWIIFPYWRMMICPFKGVQILIARNPWWGDHTPRCNLTVAHITQVVRILLSRIAFRFGIAEELLELAICFQPLGRGRDCSFFVGNSWRI